MKPVVRIVLIHVGIIIGLTILTMIASRLLNVGTVNTWLASVYVNVFLIVIYKMLWDIRTIKRKHLLINGILLFCLSIVVFGFISVNVISIGNLVFDMGW